MLLVAKLPMVPCNDMYRKIEANVIASVAKQSIIVMLVPR